MLPIVDGIETEYDSNLNVYRLDYNNVDDQRIANAYAVRTHPVVIVIDASGQPVARWNGIAPKDDILLALRNLVDLP